MKQTPIHVIVAHLKRLSLPEQIHFLRELIKHEKPHSIRGNELTSIIKGKMTRQLRRENAA